MSKDRGFCATNIMTIFSALCAKVGMRQGVDLNIGLKVGKELDLASKIY